MFNTIVKNESNDLQLKLAKDKISYDSDEIQFFIPVIVTEECLDWLEIIAENTCINEDEKIVKNFIAKVRSIRDINSNELHKKVIDQMMKL